MENLTPPTLEAVRELRWRIASGHSMKEALRLYLECSGTKFSQLLREWCVLKNQARMPEDFQRRSIAASHYQRALIDLIERGMNGQPTLEHLTALEQETERATDSELEAHIATLPFKVLIPLLLFQFPAYLLLLLGPLLRELTTQMGN